MLERTLKFGLVLLLLGSVGRSYGYVNAPLLVPAAPVAGQDVSVQIESGICDAFLDTPSQTDITRVGAAFTILIDGVHNSPGPFCNLPIITSVYPLGSFQAGRYTLQVDRRYNSLVSPSIVETLATIPFAVSAAPTEVPIPALDLAALGALCMTTLCLARRKLLAQLRLV